jgi:hypothetical protein
MLPADTIYDEVPGDPPQETAGVLQVAQLGAAGCAQEYFMGKIFGRIMADPPYKPGSQRLGLAPIERFKPRPVSGAQGCVRQGLRTFRRRRQRLPDKSAIGH